MKLFINSIVLMFLFQQIGFAKIIDVNFVNQKIRQESSNKAKPLWVAGDSWVNNLNSSQVKALLGAEVEKNDVEFIHPDSFLQSSGIPTSVDWRNKDGRNWVSPIMNQGACGSCVAFASIATLETQLNITSLVPNLNMQLSPQHLFACGGGYCSFGWRPEPAAKHLMKVGVVDEACMPYESGATGEDVRCTQVCNDAAKRIIRISDYNKPTWLFKNINKVKKALLKGPLVTTMTVYEDFMVYKSGVYKHITGNSLGGHAISLVGYDDSKQAFIIRNSWGAEWGDKGFVYISYEDTSGIGNNTWAFEVSPNAKYMTVEYPRNNEYVSGNVDFSYISNDVSVKKVQFKITDAQGKLQLAVPVVIANKTSIESTAFADGKYQVVAESLNDKDSVLLTSKPQYFYVVNKSPELVISFDGYRVDLTKEIHGRVEFVVKTHSSSVPMSQVQFYFKDPTGKVEVRSTEYVLEEMRLGWRTGQLPNGLYEIWMVGKINSKGVQAQVESEHKMVTLKN